jgi:hypothetical protein
MAFKNQWFVLDLAHLIIDTLDSFSALMFIENEPIPVASACLDINIRLHGSYYQSFCDHSRNFAWVNSKF